MTNIEKYAPWLCSPDSDPAYKEKLMQVPNITALEIALGALEAYQYCRSDDGTFTASNALEQISKLGGV